LDAGARGWTFDRGFPDQVTLTAADFLRHGSDVLDRTTARRLLPLGLADWRALLDHPAARRLSGLVLHGLPDGDAVAGFLADTPGFVHLRRLLLEVSDVTLARLARAEHLRGLTDLQIASNN